MSNFTSIEWTNIVLCYGAAEGNARQARILYQQRFRNVRVPSEGTFVSAVQHLRDNGHFQPMTADRGRTRTRRTLNAVPKILDTVEENSGTSTKSTSSIRKLSAQTGVSEFVVWRTLNEHNRDNSRLRTAVQQIESEPPLPTSTILLSENPKSSQPSTSSSGSPSTDPFCREEASCSREEAPATTLELLPEQTDQPDLRPRPPYKGGKDKMYCRLCLKPAYKNSLTPLSVVDFNYPGKSDAFRKKKLEKVEEINKMLKFCLPFYDSLTFNPIICSICLGRLKIAYEFSKECLKAQRLVEKYANTYGTIEKVINLNEMIESKFEVFNDENMSDTETEVLDIPKVTSSTSRVSKKRQYSKEDIPPAKKRKEYQEYNIQESHEEDSLTSSNEDASNVKIEPGDDDSCDLTESLKMEPDEDDSFIERVSPNVPESYNIDPNKIDDKTTIKVEPSYIDCPDFIKNEPADDLQVENKVFSERTGTGTDIEGQVENKVLSERTGAGTDIKGERSQFHDSENISLATTNTQTFAGVAVFPHVGPSLEDTTSDVIK